MKIPLDRQAKEPIYLQIRNCIGHLIHNGGLTSGAQLPSIRKLAQTVKVNKLTVLEAYSMLEAEGLVQAKRGSGYFINPPEIRSPLVSPPDFTFNPVQEVIIPGESISSFPEVYRAGLRSYNQPGYIELSQGFSQPIDIEDLQRIARRAMKEAHTFQDYLH